MSYYVYIIEKFQTYIINKYIVVNVHTWGTHQLFYNSKPSSIKKTKIIRNPKNYYLRKGTIKQSKVCSFN